MMVSSASRRNAWIGRIMLCLIGIFAVAYLVCCAAIFSWLFSERDTRTLRNGTQRHLNTPHILPRRLLSVVDTPGEVVVDSTSPIVRVKRELDRSNKTELSPNRSVNINQTHQNHLSTSEDDDRLEWKIDVHVARHSSKLGKSETAVQPQDNVGKSPRNIVEDVKDGLSDGSGGVKSNDSLGVKLSLEGGGGNSSYMDLQKAWISVGLFLQNFFENTADSNSENSTRGGASRIGSHSFGSGVGKFSLAEGEENSMSGQYTSAGHQENTTLQDFHRNRSKLESPVKVFNEVEEGFLEVDPERLTFTNSIQDTEVELDLGTRISTEDPGAGEKSELDSRNSNSSETHAKPRFLFNFFDRGSGDLENFATESSVDTRRRDGRFILGLFRARTTTTSHDKESGSGDRIEGNMLPSRMPRAELGENLSNVEKIQLTKTITDASEDPRILMNMKETEANDPSQKEARLFLGMLGFGSGDRSLPGTEGSDAKLQSSQTPIDEYSFNTHFDKDYFIDSASEINSIENRDSEDLKDATLLDTYEASYEQTTQLTYGLNTAEGIQDEIVLFRDGTENMKQTTVVYSTEELNPRFFGGIFAFSSGDGALLDGRNIEDTSKMSEDATEEVLSTPNRSEEYTNGEPVDPLEDRQTSVLYGNLQDVGNYQTERAYVESGITRDLAQIGKSGEDNYTAATETSEKHTNSLQDFYFVDSQAVSNEMESQTDHIAEFVGSSENVSMQVSDQLRSEQMAFSSGDGAISEETTKTVEEVTQRGREVRLLDDDYFDCHYPECVENVSEEHDKEEMNQMEMMEVTTSTVLKSVYSSENRIATLHDNATDISLTNKAIGITAAPERAETPFPSRGDSTNPETSKDKDVVSISYGTETPSIFLNRSFKIDTSSEASFGEILNTSGMEDRDRHLTTNKLPHDTFLVKSTELLPPFYENATSTPPPRRTKRCKASWQCDERLNERCVTKNGVSICGCVRSFVRHPTTNKCQAKTMVEAVIRFPDESYHEDLGNPESERYKKTKRAAHDTMKTLLQENSELASTVADVEVVGFKPGSLIIIWNLIIPSEGNQTLNALVDKVDNGLKESLHSPTILKKLPFKSHNVVLDVHQSAINPCKISSLNYCSENSVCIRDTAVTRGFRCACKDGFLDLSENENYPGEVCHITCAPGYCGEHGVCEVTKEGTLKCNCQGWFLGGQCQISGVAMVGSASTAVVLIFIVIFMACLLWKLKRSSAYGNDVERRFQRTEEYGPSKKDAKALGDVLPMEENRAVPSRFTYVGSTPNPSQLLKPNVPKITVTSPTVSDMSYFSDSTFDSLKS